MLVEIPDPEVILGVVVPVFVGLFSLFAYLKIRQISGSNSKNKVDLERLEFYERQLIDMKIKLDVIDIEKLSVSYENVRNFTDYEEKLHEREDVPRVNVTKPAHKQPKVSRVPNMGFDNAVETVLGLITERPMTSRDIQVTLGRSREHTSRMMKKMHEDGFVERNIKTKPFSYSITEKGRHRIGQSNPRPAEVAPPVV